MYVNLLPYLNADESATSIRIYNNNGFTDCAATYFLLFMLALPQTQYNYVNNFSHSGKKNWGLLGKKKSPMFDVAIYALVTCIYIVR